MAIAMLVMLSISCDDSEETPALSKECEILSFTIEGFEVDMTSGGPFIIIPAGTDLSKLSNLTPVIEISEGATITPASGVAQDFSKPEGVTYHVTAASKNDISTYTVEVKYVTGVEAFSLSFLGREYEGEVDPVKREIRVVLDFDDVRGFEQLPGYDLVTSVTLKDGFRVEPATGTKIDLDEPAEHTIYDDATGVATTYKLVLLNSDASFGVLSLGIPGVESSFNWDVRAGTALPQYREGLNEYDCIFVALTTDDISALTLGSEPWAIPEGATVTPALNVPQNFNQDITYTVTSQSGTSTGSFKARVVREKFIAFNSADERTTAGYWLEENSVPIIYRAVSPVTNAKLISESDGKEYACTVYHLAGNEDTPNGPVQMELSNNAVPVGMYKLHVTLQNGDAFVTTTRVTRKAF
jgi:hypothetical protein